MLDDIKGDDFMKCPYCNKEMQLGKIIGDGRLKVRWCADGEKMGINDRLYTSKGEMPVDYSLFKFRLPAYVCFECSKTIIDGVPNQ